MTARRLGILTSGGDAPGMNAAIRAATLVALDHGISVIGVEHGYRGLVRGDFRGLEADDVADIIRAGGTILGSARCPDFHERATRDTARRRLAEARIDALLIIGGNGSLAGARALADPAELGDQRLAVIGLPASIDNDVGITSLSIGVDTAMNTIVEACDKIADTASAHDRTFIVEVMGRDSGYLAMATSIAVGAEVVLFRESGKAPEALVAEVVAAVEAAHRRPGRDRHVLVVMAEGVGVSSAALKAGVDACLRGLGGDLAHTETRVTVLGHLVRGGSPSAFDRLMASRLGHAAVRAIEAGETRRMVAWSPTEGVPEGSVRSKADPRCFLVDLDAALAETQRMLDGTNPQVQWRTRVFEQIKGALQL